MKNRQERIAEFIDRLQTAPNCADFAAAFELLAQTLNAVEDAESGVPYDPDFPKDDGRMYPPKEDARRDVAGHEDLHRYRSRLHNTYFSDGGAILIEKIDGNIILDKPGLDGRSIKL